jgi:hypothetical protein
MPVFTAVAAFVSAAVGGGIFGAIAGFAARTLLTVGISKLIGNRAGANAAGTQDVGSRVHVPPASNNKLPVVYGKAYMGSTVTDMKISEDGKKMWYVCSICEVSNTMPTQTPDTYTFGNIYWGGKKVIFDSTDTSKVIQLETNSDPVQVDDKVNGKIHMYRFPNGSASGINTGGSDAITVMSDSGIPADLRWNSALYTSGGQSASMTNVAFVIVTVDYDTNAGTTGLVPINVEITNSRYKPGDVIKDYLYNDVYGCGVPLASIDTASLDDLNTYSEEQIEFIDVDGDPAFQDRYQINGPLQTGENCLTNLQQLADACDSWLQYSELTGMWKMVINKEFDGAIGDLYQVTDSNLMSGINVNPIDLNSAYNRLEVQYPNTFVLDKADYATFDLIDYAPEVMSPNEPSNQLVVQYPQVNNYIQAAYLGQRRLLQSREDLIIDFALDYSGIQIEAGDVITVKFAPYGWEAFNSGEGKLFRVSQVQEAKIDDGSLGVKITAFEYNATIYADNPLQDFIPEANTGLTDPNIFSAVPTPTVNQSDLIEGNVATFYVTGGIPASGSTLYLDFNYGATSNVAEHTLFQTVSSGDGIPFPTGFTTFVQAGDLPPGTYYWSVTARNNQAGRQSATSASFVWGGPNVTVYDPATDTGGLTWTNMGLNAAGALAETIYSVVNDYITATPPVSVTSTSSRNIPLIYPGVSIAGSQEFPYANGTSSASSPQGYITNSTGAWTPPSAALLYLTRSTGDGFLGWYKIIFNDLSYITWTTDEIVVSQAQLNLYSDTAGTTFQITPYVRFSNQANYDVLQTHFQSSYYIPYAFPFTTIATPVYNGVAAAEVIEFGYYIRNLTVGSNITCFDGTMSSRQAYPYTGSIFNG